MWPFAKRGARESTIESALPSQLDYPQFEVDDVWIKIWLPEKLTQALERLSAAHDASRPDVLRALLFEHVYGRQELEALIAWKQRRDKKAAAFMVREPQVPYPALEGKRSVSIDLFGKATEDIKLFLPRRLKAEIVTLAKTDGLGVSDYVRKTLVRMLLGEMVHQQWQTAIGNVSADVRQAEAEEEV